MTHIKKLVLLFVAQAICISCVTNKAAPEDSKLQLSTENICELPSQYLGNYVTGTSLSFGTGAEKFHENYQYEIVSAKYQWIDGRHEGVSTEYFTFPAKFKTEKEDHEIPVKKCPPKGIWHKMQ